MKLNIHLLFFEGCPNTEKARKNLREALNEAGLTLNEWEEVDIENPETYKGWKGFPSPTILVNGSNIESGKRYAEGRGSCRLGGAPPVEVILKGLERYRNTRQQEHQL